TIESFCYGNYEKSQKLKLLQTNLNEKISKFDSYEVVKLDSEKYSRMVVRAAEAREKICTFLESPPKELKGTESYVRRPLTDDEIFVLNEKCLWYKRST